MALSGRVASDPSPGHSGDSKARRPATSDTVRRALRWYLLWNTVAFVGVSVGVVVLSFVIARNEAVRDAEVTARAVARTIVALIALSLATLPLAVSLAHRVDQIGRAHV